MVLFSGDHGIGVATLPLRNLKEYATVVMLTFVLITCHHVDFAADSRQIGQNQKSSYSTTMFSFLP
jgi:hypothetical protein